MWDCCSMEDAVELLCGDEDEDMADVRLVDSDGKNALMLAAASGSEDAVRLIIDKGEVDVNATDSDGLV